MTMLANTASFDDGIRQDSPGMAMKALTARNGDVPDRDPAVVYTQVVLPEYIPP